MTGNPRLCLHVNNIICSYHMKLCLNLKLEKEHPAEHIEGKSKAKLPWVVCVNGDVILCKN
jgi:hypothetical protein